LLIDLGNSSVKWLWARGGVIDPASAGQGEIAAFEQACRSFTGPGPAAVLVSSVAGADKTRQVSDVCAACWGVEARLLASRSEQGGVRNGYPEPSQLGVDRWLAIVGAVAIHGKPVVVWDLGTATTLDAVDGSGQHLGGWILPGPATMLKSLVADTQLTVPRDLQGAAIEPSRSTAECIRGGVLAAQAGALNQFMRRIAVLLGEDPRLVVTGGAAAAVPVLQEIEHIHDPLLVFRGMLVD
jgi:type III pantothenate kinase